MALRFQDQMPTSGQFVAVWENPEQLGTPWSSTFKMDDLGGWNIYDRSTHSWERIMHPVFHIPFNGEVQFGIIGEW